MVHRYTFLGTGKLVSPHGLRPGPLKLGASEFHNCFEPLDIQNNLSDTASAMIMGTPCKLVQISINLAREAARMPRSPVRSRDDPCYTNANLMQFSSSYGVPLANLT